MQTNEINKSNIDLTNKTLNEIKTFIDEKIEMLYATIAAVEESDLEKKESLISECKIIFIDLQIAFEQIVSKYKDSISLDEYNEYVEKVNVLKKNLNSFKDFGSVANTFMAFFGATGSKDFSIESTIERIDSKIHELFQEEDSF